jgi:mono/diheme cytochrome c family protein
MAKLFMAKLLVIFTLITAALSSVAYAQEFDAGKFEYQAGCGACHGIDGKGGGPASPQIKVRPADLTILTKNNNGVFPFNSVYEIIDGRKAVAARGTRDMPIWGNRYMPEFNRAVIPRAFEHYVPSFDPETIVRMRILAVIDYLDRIQEK